MFIVSKCTKASNSVHPDVFAQVNSSDYSRWKWLLPLPVLPPNSTMAKSALRFPLRSVNVASML